MTKGALREDCDFVCRVPRVYCFLFIMVRLRCKVIWMGIFLSLISIKVIVTAVFATILEIQVLGEAFKFLQ